LLQTIKILGVQINSTFTNYIFFVEYWIIARFFFGIIQNPFFINLLFQ